MPGTKKKDVAMQIPTGVLVYHEAHLAGSMRATQRSTEGKQHRTMGCAGLQGQRDLTYTFCRAW